MNPTSVAQRLLSAAELLALGSTPVQLVAAPGAGKLIVPYLALFAIRPGSAQYVQTGDDLVIGWAPGAGHPVGLVLIAVGGALLEQTYGHFDAAPLSPGGFGSQDNAIAVNRGLVIGTSNGTDPTDGDGTLLVTVWYGIAAP